MVTEGINETKINDHVRDGVISGIDRSSPVSVVRIRCAFFSTRIKRGKIEFIKSTFHLFSLRLISHNVLLLWQSSSLRVKTDRRAIRSKNKCSSFPLLGTHSLIIQPGNRTHPSVCGRILPHSDAKFRCTTASTSASALSLSLVGISSTASQPLPTA